MDANEIHELLIFVLLFLFIPTFFVTATYLLALMKFFKDLREKEHDLWVKIGSPTPANMIFIPFINYHKYYAFLPHVLERAKPEAGYSTARTVVRLMKLCSILMSLLFLNVIIIIAWIIVNDL